MRGVSVASTGILTQVSKSKILCVKITSKGQVTIPQHIRERYGLLPDTEVEFAERDGSVVIVPRASERPDRGDKAVAVLRGTGRGRMSTDELLLLTRD